MKNWISPLIDKIFSPNGSFKHIFCVREYYESDFKWTDKQNGVSYCKIYQVNSGVATLHFMNQVQEIGAGYYVFIPSTQVFQITSQGSISITICGFSMPLQVLQTINPEVLMGKTGSITLNCLLSSNEVPHNITQHYAKAIITAMLMQSQFYMDRDQSMDLNDGLSGPELLAIMNYIRSRLSEKHSTEDLARVVNKNPQYFRKSFKTKTGQSPQQFIIKEKVLKACDLLFSGRYNISEICNVLGYKSAQHFSRQFKGVMGISPKKWAQKQLQKMLDETDSPPSQYSE